MTRQTRISFIFGPTGILTRAAAVTLFALMGGGSAIPAAAQEEDAKTAETQDCPAAHCLSVALPSALAGESAADGMTIAELAERLTVTYQGETPFPVHLVAARYDDGRLVRYGVSPRTVLETAGDGLKTAEMEKTLAHAFRPTTPKRVTIGPVAHDRLSGRERIAGEAFIGEVPAAYLAGTDPVGLVPLDNVDPDKVHETFSGAIGVLVVLPENASLRSDKDVRLQGALIRLNYGDKAVGTADSG